MIGSVNWVILVPNGVALSTTNQRGWNMRLSVITIFSASVLLFSLSAHAGTWPETEREAYREQCVKGFKEMGSSDEQAKTKCDCHINLIQKNFSDKEIKALSGHVISDQKLAMRALAVMQLCK
jgi:acetylglutamate synthase